MKKEYFYILTFITFVVSHPRILLSLAATGVIATTKAQYIVAQLGNGDTVHLNVINGSKLWKFDSSILNKKTWDSMDTKLCIRNLPTIPTNTNQLINGAAFLISSDISGKKNISDSVGNSGYATLFQRNKLKDSLQANIDTKISGNQTITLSGDVTGAGTTAITTTLANSGISAGTYMGATYDSKGRATSGANPVIDTLSASRSFNTAYLMSSTKYVDVKISAEITCALSLSGGQDGSITLQTSPDASAWTTVGRMRGSNTGTLTIGLSTSQITGGQLSTLLPPNYYWKLLTTNNTGIPTFTMQQGNKITY